MNTNIQNFQLLNQKWGESQTLGTPGGQVTISFANSNFNGQRANFDHFITDKAFQNDILESLSMWEEISNISFILVNDSNSVDIRFGYAEIDGPTGIVGQTHLPVLGELAAVQIVLDFDENWVVGSEVNSDGLSVKAVNTHEIGHAIGIAHSPLDEALMSAFYNPAVTSLQEDDIAAARAIYGNSNIEKVDVNRFLNPANGGHFFTASLVERNVVLGNSNFEFEGIGFKALSPENLSVEGTSPVFRFYNSDVGSHFFTASLEERESVMSMENFSYEGIGFNAFDSETVSKTPVYRFFNLKTGGHLFTTFEAEREVLAENVDFRYEGIGFYAFDAL
ncbi:MAG: hypothetical protein CMF67_12055 [Magnetovibrio sp.]|nr:hypothetical protein [Magnetovibrio sp.]|tara:strand:+ start:4954 stop:5958 length:1005 start_codon:yes stop_codon:yes gene_type:complete